MPGKKLKAVKEHFYSYLRQNGLKKTHQKDLILETFAGTEGHLSVEDVYALVKRRDKKIGIVTVFRTLKSLTECGIAREITLGDGLTRFEHRYHHPNHHHIVCTSCYKAIEFVSPELERVQDGIIREYGFQATSQRLQIYGTCQDCLTQRPVKDSARIDTGKIFARDALRMALYMENLGVEFFRRAASRNLDPNGRKIFELLAEEEERHLAELQANLEDLNRQVKGLEQAPLFLHFDEGELAGLVPDLKDHEQNGGLMMGSESALKVALSLERGLAGFFRSYAEKFVETEGKRIFQQFADDEIKHCEAVSRQAEKLVASS
jgi:Fur family ferric uptake transcriptional regulator